MKLGSRPVIWAFPLAVLAAWMALIAADPGGLATYVRNLQFDSYQYLHPRRYEDPGPKANLTVRTLEVDQAAVAKFGPWPWGAGTLAHIVERLRENGAAIVVLAFPLDGIDSASPARFVSELPPGPGNDSLRAALAAMPAPEDALVASIARIRTVTGFTLRQTSGGRDPSRVDALNFEGPAVSSPGAKFAYASAPPARIEQTSAGEGALNLARDADGKLRGLPMLFRLSGATVPSIDGEVLRIATGQRQITLHTAVGTTPIVDIAPRFTSLKSGPINAPLRSDGALTIYFSGRNVSRNISAAALDEALPPDALKNAIVYLAAPDSVVPTPAGLRSEADVRAEAMENLLLGQALRPASDLPAQLIVLAVLGLGLVALFARFGALWAGLAAAAAIAALQAFTWNMFTASELLLDSANPSLALAFAFFAGLAARSMEYVRTRNNLKGAFADALAPAVLDRIASQPSLLKLDGETRGITYMACGVRGYAALAESFRDDPAGFTRLMRTLLAPLVADVFALNGTLDRYSGDGFGAFWNAPLEDGEHAIHACEAANRMTVALSRVNEQLAGERRLDGTAYQPLEIGISIATGPAIIGGFGSAGRMGYGVTGDCTALAERVRAISAQYGPAVIVTDETRKAAERGFAFLEVDFVAGLSAGDNPVKLYAMLGNPLVRASPKFRAMATFHEHIFNALRTQQWDKARELIEQCRKLSGASQKMYDLHLRRIAYYQANPPGAEWDGAFRPVLK